MGLLYNFKSKGIFVEESVWFGHGWFSMRDFAKLTLWMASSVKRLILWVLCINCNPEIYGRHQLGFAKRSIIRLKIKGEKGHPW